MALNKVDICGLDTSSLPRLTQQQSRELLLKIKEGDVQAREDFIRANLRLVLSVIQRFSGRGEQMDDLFQVGCIGLIKAVENFNTDLEVRFSTYAVPMIIGELRRYLRDNTTLRVSRSLRDTAYKALRVRNDLMDRFSREPRLDEIAKELNMSEEDVAFALEAIQDPVSLFEPIYHDDGDAIFVMDQVRDDKDCDDCWLDGIAIGSGLDRLATAKEKSLSCASFRGARKWRWRRKSASARHRFRGLKKAPLNT